MQIDRRVVSAIGEGDEKVIFQLYSHCYSELSAVCRRYVHNDDEIGGLLNAGFLKIVDRIGSYPMHIPFEAWIRRIMINTAIDAYRKNRRYRETIHLTDLAISSSHASAVDYNEADLHFDAEQLLDLIRQLPSMTNQVFNLFALDGYSHKEIASMLDIAEGTSKWHLSTARKKLRAMVETQMSKCKTESIKSKISTN
jgi:RNA polymerase sigma factor (sigma-70 family)